MWESPRGYFQPIRLRLQKKKKFAFANGYSGPSLYEHLGLMTTFLFLERKQSVFTLQPRSSNDSVITTNDRALLDPPSLFSIFIYLINTTSGMSMINS